MAGTWYVSVQAISSSLATLRVQIGPWTTVEPSEPAWPHPKSLELAIWSTMLDLALDSEVRPSTSQYWPGNCLSSGTETMCVEGSHRNGNICHQTSYTMMMTIIPNGTFLWPRQKVWINSWKERWLINEPSVLNWGWFLIDRSSSIEQESPASSAVCSSAIRT